MAEDDRFPQEVARLREELRIKDARMERVPAPLAALGERNFGMEERLPLAAGAAVQENGEAATALTETMRDACFTALAG